MSSYSFQTRAHHKEDYLLRRTTKLLVQMQYCLNTFKFYEIQNNLPLLLVFIVYFRDVTLERVDVKSCFIKPFRGIFTLLKDKATLTHLIRNGSIWGYVYLLIEIDFLFG